MTRKDKRSTIQRLNLRVSSVNSLYLRSTSLLGDPFLTTTPFLQMCIIVSLVKGEKDKQKRLFDNLRLNVIHRPITNPIGKTTFPCALLGFEPADPQAVVHLFFLNLPCCNSTYQLFWWEKLIHFEVNMRVLKFRAKVFFDILVVVSYFNKTPWTVPATKWFSDVWEKHVGTALFLLHAVMPPHACSVQFN